MIKGVNKSIIEIHDTDSEYFDKVLLFVNPKFYNADRKIIKSQAMRLLKRYEKDSLRIKKSRKGYGLLKYALMAASSVSMLGIVYLLLRLIN